MKSWSSFLNEVEFNQLRQHAMRHAQADQVFKGRQYLFSALRRIGMNEFKDPQTYATPEGASQLYNQYGRSQGILNMVQRNPTLVRSVLEQWFKLAFSGDLPVG